MCNVMEQALQTRFHRKWLGLVDWLLATVTVSADIERQNVRAPRGL